jgi:DNA-3-methyladenine glycosylase II
MMSEKPKASPKLKSIKSIQKYLATQDERLGRFLENAPLYPVAKEPAHNSHFETIVFAVIGQQLSGKAADTITHRLIAKAGSPVKPAKILKLGHLQLREIGLSNAKARTIIELSEAIVNGFDLESVDEFPDDEVIKQLTQFWGIGRWTVEMFMMFRLGRLDVWPIGDLGVRRGWGIIQGLGYTPTEKEVIGVTDHLSPYRSVVAWHCWRATDEEPDFW